MEQVACRSLTISDRIKASLVEHFFFYFLYQTRLVQPFLIANSPFSFPIPHSPFTTPSPLSFSLSLFTVQSSSTPSSFDSVFFPFPPFFVSIYFADEKHFKTKESLVPCLARLKGLPLSYSSPRFVHSFFHSHCSNHLVLI